MTRKLLAGVVVMLLVLFVTVGYATTPSVGVGQATLQGQPTPPMPTAPKHPLSNPPRHPLPHPPLVGGPQAVTVTVLVPTPPMPKPGPTAPMPMPWP